MSTPATEHKFLCLMHSETKQTERKVLAGPRMETGGRCPTLPELPKGLNGKAFVKSGEGGVSWLMRASWCKDPLSTQVRPRCSCKPLTRKVC